MKVHRVGVVGCGLMGSGIAQVCAMSGYQTTVRDVSDEVLAKGLGSIRESLARFTSKGRITAQQSEEAQKRLYATTALEEVADCDLVIEAVTENIQIKQDTYRQLDRICKKETIFATNTSSLCVTELMTATQRPERFIGMHFFNPVVLMQLVELVKTVATDAVVFGGAVEFVRTLGKVPIRATDRSGFIVNRLLIPYLLDAVRAVEEGVGSVEDIDNGMKLGCGYPMGPFTLLDFVGLDTTYYAANIMFDEYKEKRFAPPPLLKQMVLAGHLGRKSGKGFYDYKRD